MTRWDLAHSVSRTGQTCKSPTQGTVDQLRQIAGYLNNTRGLKLRGRRLTGENKVETMTDANHHGDPKFTSNSQTGVIILLNGVPVHWRSNRQPVSVISPAESEIYALSAGVKDTQLYHWVLEEMTGISNITPIIIKTDSSSARSFQSDTCPATKLRGCFDFRERWVAELRDLGKIKAEYIPEARNMADIFTKCLSHVEFVVRLEQIAHSQGSLGRL